MGLIGGRASAAVGPLLSVGQAILQTGKELLSLKLIIPAAVIGLGYLAYRYVTLGGAIKEANEQLDKMNEKLRAQERDIRSQVKAIENQMAIMRGAAPSSLIAEGNREIYEATRAKEALAAAQERKQAVLAADAAVATLIIGLERELSIMRGERTEADFIVNAYAKRLHLQRESLRIERERETLRQQQKDTREAGILGGMDIRSASDAMKFLRGQEVSASVDKARSTFLEQAAQHLFANVKLSDEMISVLKRLGLAGFGGSATPPVADAAAPSYGFGLASQHRWSNITRPAIGVTADMSKTKSVEKQLELLIQQGLSGRGIKVQAAGMN